MNTPAERTILPNTVNSELGLEPIRSAALPGTEQVRATPHVCLRFNPNSSTR